MKASREVIQRVAGIANPMAGQVIVNREGRP
jgi:hypothetical protein